MTEQEFNKSPMLLYATELFENGASFEDAIRQSKDHYDQMIFKLTNNYDEDLKKVKQTLVKKVFIKAGLSHIYKKM